MAQISDHQIMKPLLVRKQITPAISNKTFLAQPLSFSEQDFYHFLNKFYTIFEQRVV